MTNRDNPISFYIVVNKDLEMSKGKVAAQVGHAVQYLCEEYVTALNLGMKCRDFKELYDEWALAGSGKIVLSATRDQFTKLKALKPLCIIKDAGHTQVNKGTETVLAFAPMRKSEQLDALKELKLY